jgi:glycosyltransferase involved in cell wall biosynthesis
VIVVCLLVSYFMRPLISVVSASWNQGRHLAECHRSVLPLERGLVEHIVVDNCSDDETSEVLNQFPEIVKIVEKDRGQSEALNKGFAMAKGEWILWLNVDDFLLPGVIDRMLKILQTGDAHFDLLYGHTVFVDAESRTIRTVYQPIWHYWMTAIGCYAAPSTGSLYRRRILVEHPLDENFHMIMDTEWMLRVGRQLGVRRLNHRTVSFRIDDNKTAGHIQSGELTPRHRSEREALAKNYRSYDENEDRSLAGRLLIKLARKCTRLWILGDKFISKTFLLKLIHPTRKSK